MIPGIVAWRRSGSAYTGPLDLFSTGITFAHSQRALSSAWTDPVIRIKRASDSTEQSFSPTVNNAVSVADITSFLSGTTPSAMTMFDQSGLGLNVVQETATLIPGWAVIGASSRPAVGPKAASADGSSILTNFDTSPTLESVTIFLAQYISPNGTSNMDYCGAFTAGDEWFNFYGSKPNLSIIISDAAANTTEWFAEGDFSGLHILEATIDASGNAKIYVDGVDLGAALLGDVIPINFASVDFEYSMVRTTAGVSPVEEALYEGLVYRGVLSAGNRLLIRQNMADYYGITLP